MLAGTLRALIVGGLKVATLTGLTLAITVWAQSTPSTFPTGTVPGSTSGAEADPGTPPIGCDTPGSAPAQKPNTPSQPGQKPAPGTTPVGCDTAPAVNVSPEKVIEPGSQKINVKPGSIDDVSAVGNRGIGGRGIGNWYSTDTEIKMGKMYSMQIEKSTNRDFSRALNFGDFCGFLCGFGVGRSLCG